MTEESRDIEIAMLKRELDELRQDTAEIKESVSDLVDAWRAAGVLVAAVKVAAALVLAVGVIYGAIRYGFNPPEVVHK